MANKTPLVTQYEAIKAQHPGALLLFRLGDFYETFGEDAKVASKVLGIVLTSRDKGAKEKVPLAGIPYHALDGYLAKLIKAGDMEGALAVARQGDEQATGPATQLEDRARAGQLARQPAVVVHVGAPAAVLEVVERGVDVVLARARVEQRVAQGPDRRGPAATASIVGHGAPGAR